MMFKRFLGEYRDFKPLIVLVGQLLLIVFILFGGLVSNGNFKLFSPIPSLELSAQKSGYEVFGFAPHWKINSLDNIDFSTLTTLAYFDAPVNADGTIDRGSPGFETFKSEKATELFTKAHKNGTKVVLTLTQMDNHTIESFLDSPRAQEIASKELITEVKNRGIDGINVDIEYVGTPGGDYRSKFTRFVESLANKLHSEVPNSQITVSVYASAAKQEKLYDIASLSKVSDGIFMMAYDFAVKGADQAMPTAPLYGHKQGKYWYDISTAVDDFLKVMPSQKLILGLPWYGYDYPVYEPAVLAETHRGYAYWYKQWTGYGRWYWRKGYSKPPSYVQTYKEGVADVEVVKTGWDNLGKVGWKAYKEGGTWRMFFLEDAKSLGIKYDFAKSKKLGGVGIWALGFDEGTSDMWQLLRTKFGKKLADATIVKRNIQ
jgi:spore germination protein